jgi:biopolymer transport protein ExbB
LNLFKIVSQGGVFMYPLLLASVLALALSLERLIYFSRLEGGAGEFLQKMRKFITENKVSEATTWLQGLNGPVPAVVEMGLRNWEESEKIVEDSIAAQSHLEVQELQRNLPVLETVVTASPLIGLLGTITGMMGVFRAVAEKLALNPQADTSAILAGIGEALIATATGILVAVFCLLCHNLFQGMAERQMSAMQRAVNELLLLRHQTRN